MTILFLGSISFPAFAQVSRNTASHSPMDLLNQVVERSNEEHKIQDTKLDGITSVWSYGPAYRLTNTLEYIKNNIHPYIQWVVYLGLAVATIMLIYNGFLMVTNVIHEKGELSKIKGNFVWIGIGVVILTGFYYLIDIVLAIVNFLFE